MTSGAAKALGHHREYGGLIPGQRADLNILKTADYRDLVYYFGENFIEQTWIAGRRVQGGKEPASF